MAKPIPLEIEPRDPRAELRARLDAAPVEHAEALLSAYDVLQGLHDKGMLDTLRGAIGSSDQILEMLTEAAKKPEAIRGMRNLIMLSKIAGAFDLEKAREQQPLTLLQLLKKMRSEDSRRALTVLVSALESAGKALQSEGQK
jgi:uncharacterized protein YjgD (DUF1641 family)